VPERGSVTGPRDRQRRPDRDRLGDRQGDLELHHATNLLEIARELGVWEALPRIFLDLVLPRLPALGARLQESGRVLDVGCGGGWAVVQLAERFPKTSCVGIDVEPYSVDLARRLIAERGLADRVVRAHLGQRGRHPLRAA
jgi:predicted O-methyltransferase YrrM